MRWAFCLILLCSTVGCSTSRHAQTPARPVYSDAPATALVFDSSLVMDEPPIFLPRDERAASAFVGFDDLTTTFIHIRTEDRHASDGSDRYVRRAVIHKAGLSYR